MQKKQNQSASSSKSCEQQQPASSSANNASTFEGGVDWSQFRHYAQRCEDESGEEEDIMLLPQLTRNPLEVENEMKRLDMRRQQKAPPVFVPQPNFRNGKAQANNSDDEIVCLDDVEEPVNKVATSRAKAFQPKKHTKSVPLQSIKESPPAKKQATLSKSVKAPQRSAQQFPSFPQQSRQPSAQSFPQQSNWFPQPYVHIRSLRPFRQVMCENSNLQADGRRPNFTLRICTFNVLCEVTKMKCSHLYTIQQQEMDWESRRRLLVDEIASLNADIFCLQEVQQDHFIDFYEPFFNEIGFKSFFTGRDGIENVDGCLVAYRNDNRYKELGFKHLSYNIDAENFKKNNVGQLLLLEDVRTGIVFMVANTHILFNMRRGDFKTAQIAYLLASIDNIESGLHSKNKYAGVLLCGDFNIEPRSPLYNFIRNGSLHYSKYHFSLLAFDQSSRNDQQQNQNEEQQSFKLEKKVLLDPLTCKFVKSVSSDRFTTKFTHQQRYLSAYRHQTENNEREVSTYHRYFGCPDFIFYSAAQSQNGQVAESRIMVRKILMLPSIKDIRRSCGPMPNQQCGSDHLPLMAEFTLF